MLYKHGYEIWFWIVTHLILREHICQYISNNDGWKMTAILSDEYRSNDSNSGGMPSSVVTHVHLQNLLMSKMTLQSTGHIWTTSWDFDTAPIFEKTMRKIAVSSEPSTLAYTRKERR